MTETLEILRRSHQALLDYEASRQARQGPRGEAGQAAVHKVAEAHRDAWARAGGKPEDFLLAEPLGEGPAPSAKPKSDEAPAERPRAKSRAGA